LPPATEAGALGIFQLKRIWRALSPRNKAGRSQRTNMSVISTTS
jgi:hypothetical protein